MRVFPRSLSRSAWVVLTNGLMLYGLAGSTNVSGPMTIANGMVAAALSLGILLELTGSLGAAVLNVVSFLSGPFFWAWERMHDAHFEDHPGEYNLTLVIFVLPCLIIIAVNLFLYVPPFLKWRRGRRAMTS